jgi:pimeloyl-ACP methyl ester carboxylesterase
MHRLFSLLCLLLGMPIAIAAVPVDIHVPTTNKACTSASSCPVAVLSPGYGLAGSDYSFITNRLTAMGYMVVALEQSGGGKTMEPNANRVEQLRVLARLGAQSLTAVLNETALHLLLVGHSLGGDSSALFATENAKRVSRLITLDNRRLALPRSPDTNVLTIRASDTSADPGVLPSDEERSRYAICVVHIKGSHHNDMQDEGSEQLKSRIASAIDTFLAPASSPKYACDRDSNLD